MDRAQKEKIVEELGQIFDRSGLVVVARYEGMTVAEMTAFRHAMQDAGGVRVAKNKLAKIALAGRSDEDLGARLTGMSVFAYGEDPVATAKAIEGFVKQDDKLELIAGTISGQVIDRDGIAAVAKMPSREETIATIVGMLTAPASNLAGAFGAPGSAIAGAIGAPGAAMAGILEAKAAA